METIGLIWNTEAGRSRDCIGNGYRELQAVAAPFVAKTYQMVNDPRSNSLIRWGKKNNSFLVIDPNAFSQLLLPSSFKHRNFSSFIRQLNTYGFRKVDPDRWEFAHESFLRGQTHLLPFITRRRRSEGDGGLHGISSSRNDEIKKESTDGELEERALLQELDRLRREQRALEAEVEAMSKRLQATERRPHQLMSFLAKVAEDPGLLPRLVRSKKQQLSMEKKRRLFAPTPAPTDCGRRLLLPLNGDNNSSMKPTSFNPFETTTGLSTQWEETIKPLVISSTASPQIGNFDLSSSEASFQQPKFGPSRMSSGAAAASTVAFPFSLLGHGFF